MEMLCPWYTVCGLSWEDSHGWAMAQMNGGWNYLETSHSHVWCMGQDDVRAGLSWAVDRNTYTWPLHVDCTSQSDWVGASRKGASGEREFCDPDKAAWPFVRWPRKSQNVTSTLLGQSSHRSAHIQGKVIEISPPDGAISKNLWPFLKPPQHPIHRAFFP